MKALQTLTGTLILLAAAGVERAQGPIWIAPPPAGPTADTRRAMDAHGNSAELEERLDKVRQSDRQKKMISDTRKLLALAAELRAAMEKADPEKTGTEKIKEPSPSEVIKKADEIEKLARNVKERMRG